MQNTFRVFLIAAITAMASACATFDEPLGNIEAPEDELTQQDSQRLLIPEPPAAVAPTEEPLPEVAQTQSIEQPQNPQPADSGRLAVPLPVSGTEENNVTDNGVPTAVTNSPPSTPAVRNDSTAQSADAPLIAGNQPHHRTDDISVVTWRAERGHVPSQLLLGRAYFRGDGVPRDMELARLWLELASIQGDKKAQYELGLMYFIGAGVEKDYANAHAWWNEAARDGNDQAQQKLGYMYSEGLGVERDYEQAKNWYLKAATLGNAEAQTLLGSLLHEGNRVAPDYTQAFAWYQRAAEQGHPHAQYALAILHHDGLGTPQDYIKCAAWVEVALANRYSDELGAREQCRSQLDEQSNAAADSLASLWKSQYLQ